MGEFPVECVKVMNRVATTTEQSINYWKRFKWRSSDIENCNYEFNMNYAVCTTAVNIEAKAIIAYTNTGNTARIVSSFGPGCPIFAITANEITYRQLGLCSNIVPKLYTHQSCIDDLIEFGIETLKLEGFLQTGDKILVAGRNKSCTKFRNK